MVCGHVIQMMMSMSNSYEMVTMYEMIWLNKSTKNSTEHIHKECKYCTSVTVRAVSRSITLSHPIQFDSSPKSLSSAETLPYHAGFPKDGSESKGDNIKEQ